MVDGINVGKGIEMYTLRECKNGCDFNKKEPCSDCSDTPVMSEQNFRDADMVVVLDVGYGISYPDNLKEGTDIRDNLFHCFGIYGAKVIQAGISGTELNQLSNLGRKVVWAKKKPYILNGDKL